MNKKNFSFRSLINKLSHLNLRRLEECSTLIRWLEAKPRERILDLGCGDGYYDSIIGASGANVVGVDIHHQRLATALQQNRNTDIQFHFMNAEELNFPDASFDKAVSFCVVEHFNRDEQVMQHIARILKPGGSFIFSADSLSNPEITAEERIRHQLRYAVNTFYTAESVEEKLSRSGFQLEKTQYILNTPYALALIRLSWKLDNLPRVLKLFRLLGFLALAILGMATARFISLPDFPAKGGLTLLVHARKPVAVHA